MRSAGLCLLLFFLILSGRAGAQETSLSAGFSGGSLGKIGKNETVADSLGNLCRQIVLYGKLDPQNPFDAAAHRSNRWFHFKMSGLGGDSVRLEIRGSDPLHPFYSYDNIRFCRLTPEEFRDRTLTKRFGADSVYLAYCIPYPYERVQERIAGWVRRENCVAVDTIGFSAEGRPLQLLRITDSRTPDAGKKRIWIQARTHPSETPASFLLEGIVDRLLEQEERALLRQAVFYVVPLENPDGVAGGLSRSDGLGIDHEGNYDSCPEETTREVAAYKARIRALFGGGEPLDLFLALHAQVARKSSFWIHTPESSSWETYRKKQLLYYNTVFHTPMRAGDSDYNARRDRVPEGWLFREFGGRTAAVTLEVPYTYYHTPDRPVTEENLRLFGSGVVDAAAAMLGLNTASQILLDDDAASYRRAFRKKEVAHAPDEPLVYGDSYLEARRKGKAVSYLSPVLPTGRYGVYRWMPAVNGWEPVREVRIASPRRIEVRLESREKGEIFDGLLICRLPKNCYF